MEFKRVFFVAMMMVVALDCPLALGDAQGPRPIATKAPLVPNPSPQPCSADHAKGPRFQVPDIIPDGQITPEDALQLLCCLNDHSQHESCKDANLDVNGDGQLSPIDILLVINYLNKFNCPFGKVAAPACPKPPEEALAQ
jgi:hypothetical protein